MIDGERRGEPRQDIPTKIKRKHTASQQILKKETKNITQDGTQRHRQTERDDDRERRREEEGRAFFV